MRGQGWRPEVCCGSPPVSGPAVGKRPRLMTGLALSLHARVRSNLTWVKPTPLKMSFIKSEPNERLRTFFHRLERFSFPSVESRWVAMTTAGGGGGGVEFSSSLEHSRSFLMGLSEHMEKSFTLRFIQVLSSFLKFLPVRESGKNTKLESRRQRGRGGAAGLSCRVLV